MALSSRITAFFSLSASALFGASVVLLYDQFGPNGSRGGQGVRLVTPHRPHADGSAVTHGSTGPAASSSSSALDMPVVLPPRVSGAARHAVTEAFHQDCVEAARLGLPSSAEVRCYGGYIASLSYERRLPNWVLECLPGTAPSASSSSSSAASSDQDEPKGGEVSRARSQFFADATVPTPFRVAADAYTTRGLSRGHLAAARFHKHSQEEMDSTFNMNANMVPQDMTVNAMDWERLESLTSRLSREVARGPGSKKGAKRDPAAATSSARGRLYVVSGPVFMPQAVQTREHWANGVTVQALGPDAPLPTSAQRRVVQYELTGKNNSVAVPTHLFKVLLAEKGLGSGSRATYELAAFVMPNRPIPEEKPLTDYQVPLATLESVTGLSFFPGLHTPARSLPNLCASHECNSRPSALFAKYRDVAQLRAATSVPELRHVYAKLKTESEQKGGTTTLDSMVEKEFHSRTAELVAESVRGVDSD